MQQLQIAVGLIVLVLISACGDPTDCDKPPRAPVAPAIPTLEPTPLSLGKPSEQCNVISFSALQLSNSINTENVEQLLKTQTSSKTFVPISQRIQYKGDYLDRSEFHNDYGLSLGLSRPYIVEGSTVDFHNTDNYLSRLTQTGGEIMLVLTDSYSEGCGNSPRDWSPLTDMRVPQTGSFGYMAVSLPEVNYHLARRGLTAEQRFSRATLGLVQAHPNIFGAELISQISSKVGSGSQFSNGIALYKDPFGTWHALSPDEVKK